MWRLKNKYKEIHLNFNSNIKTLISSKYYVDKIKQEIAKQPEDTRTIHLLVSYNKGEKLFPIQISLLPNEVVTDAMCRVDSYFKNSLNAECRKCSVLYMSYSKISKSASVVTKDEVLNYYHDAKGFVKLIVFPTLNMELKEDIDLLVELMTLFQFEKQMQEIIVQFINF